METCSPFIEVNEAIREMGGEDLNNCMQCGLCTGSCPWRLVDGDFSVRQMIRLAQLGLEGYESDDVLYGCTTCGVCVQRCPREVAIIDIMRSVRSMIMETGAIPKPLQAVVGSIHSNRNPWGEDAEKRVAWQKELEVPVFDGTQEYFLFVCCTSAYDRRSQQIARSMVKILRAVGVSFGIIGNEESCCGESVRKIGAEEAFQTLAAKNLGLWGEKGVQKIITTSPHCFYTIREEYPGEDSPVQVQHYTQVLASLLAEGRIALEEPIEAMVTYHDPCYLGRHSGVYDPPRSLLTSIPGVEFVEMDRNRENSLCCGGGGGRVWMETKAEQRFSDLRIQEALDAGARILATACPYCITMLEDSRKTTGAEDKIEVLDVSEIVVRAMGL